MVSEKINCNRGSLNTDWCQADAMRDSLREHMRLLKEARERIAELEEQRVSEIVIGDRLIDDKGDAQGTILSTSHWDNRIIENGLGNVWCQIIIRPLKVKK